MFAKGTIVILNGRIGVVAHSGKELSRVSGGNLDDHTGVWFGTFDGGFPEVWTIPTEYLAKGPLPVFKH